MRCFLSCMLLVPPGMSDSFDIGATWVCGLWHVHSFAVVGGRVPEVRANSGDSQLSALITDMEKFTDRHKLGVVFHRMLFIWRTAFFCNHPPPKYMLHRVVFIWRIGFFCTHPSSMSMFHFVLFMWRIAFFCSHSPPMSMFHCVVFIWSIPMNR